MSTENPILQAWKNNPGMRKEALMDILEKYANPACRILFSLGLCMVDSKVKRDEENK